MEFRSRRYHCSIPQLLSVVLLFSNSLNGDPPKLPRGEPASVGMRAAKLAEIDSLVADEISKGTFPGCVIAIGRHGKLVLHRAYGHRQLKPHMAPMKADTVFDLASVTKPIATATSVMILVEHGKIDLFTPVAEYIPEFGQNGKGEITVFQLLTHQGGLIADNPLSDYLDGPHKAWERIFALKSTVEPGTKFVYSDVGFLVLAELVRRVSGEDVHVFSQRHVFEPLAMGDTTYRPTESQKQRAAVNEQRDGRWMQGDVHDPRSYRLGGITGHAGLFSTAEDLAIHALMMLNQGQYGGVRIMEKQTMKRMIRPNDVAGRFWGLGWGIRTGAIPEHPQWQVVGHLGYTGTSVRFSPDLDLFVVFLSNRLHPEDPGSLDGIASAVHQVWAKTIEAVELSGASPDE